MPTEIRRPAVAGAFYEADRTRLVREIEACYLDRRGPGKIPTVNESGPRNVIGLVNPHAGYVYSGPVAGFTFRALRDSAAAGRAPETSGAWATPLGESPVHEALAARLAGLCPGLQVGAGGFVGEHSLEVQVPFIQHLFGLQTPIVPIMMLDQDASAARAIGNGLAEALAGENAVIVASTDMTHFESAELAARQDRILIDRMEALDPEGLLRERERRGITMCGYGPVAAMLFAALKLGATQAGMIDYTNSGEVSASREVVAYLSLIVSRGGGE